MQDDKLIQLPPPRNGNNNRKPYRRRTPPTEPASLQIRSVKKYRKEGTGSFYQPRKGRGPKIMTVEVTAQAQKLLDTNYSRREIA